MNTKVSFTPVFFWMFFVPQPSSRRILASSRLAVPQRCFMRIAHYQSLFPIRWSFCIPLHRSAPLLFRWFKRNVLFFRRWISLFFTYRLPSAGSWAFTLPTLSMLHIVFLRIYYITFARTRISFFLLLFLLSHALLPPPFQSLHRLVSFYVFIVGYYITLKPPFFLFKNFHKTRIFFLLFPLFIFISVSFHKTKSNEFANVP